MSQLLTIRRRFQSRVIGRPGSDIRTMAPLAVLAVFLAALSPARLRGAEEGVALAIVYDTSGSMKESVPDASGGSSPKYVIANRALKAVTRQLEAYATNG